MASPPTSDDYSNNAMRAQGRPRLPSSPGSASPLLTPSVSPRPTTSGFARNNLGSSYGPYSYERRPDSVGTTLSDLSYFPNALPTEKQAHSPLANQGVVSNQNVSGMPIYMWHTTEPEEDDALHAPDNARGRGTRQPFVLCSARGWTNAGALALLLAAVLMLFLGYPIIAHFREHVSSVAGFNLGGINGTGQVPDLPGMKRLVDPMTPDDAQTRVGSDGKTYNLVFSDEFETDGRTFYPGDDPYWEAQDLNYWPTGDMEWYDPQAITTKDGKLVITISKKDPINNHNLSYMSGMLTSWNKFCFTTGYIEVSLSIPGTSSVSGFWPGVWTLGNLGRAGFGATTDGTWPYSYDTCDIGTYPRQMDKAGNPESSTTDGWQGAFLSDQPGQKLSACTCPGSDHPGPDVSKGRNVPELDVIEAQISGTQGEASQSFQVAPFNAFVKFDNDSSVTTVFDESITKFNSFSGTALQQAVSAVTNVDSTNYGGNGFAKFGFEYWSDMNNRDDGYITWYSQGQESWKITSASIGPDSVSQVSQRLIPEEPMYIIMNLGLSTSFTTVDLEHLVFPASMFIDYVRVYQRSDVKDGVTCDPPSHPTADYINAHPEAYTNVNWTTWQQAGYTYPRNSQYDGC